MTKINPDITDAQISAVTNIIIDSATDFFANTETSKIQDMQIQEKKPENSTIL